jgi:cell division protein FtsZ
VVESTAPGAKERLSRIFAEDAEPSGAMYGRDEPDYSRSYDPSVPHTPVIRVVGVGGAGVNAVNRMVEAGIPGVEFMAINTDLQSLQQSLADVTVHLGTGASRGLGAGSNPELGYRAAFEEQDKIKRLLKGSDMVFVAAGAGGGTGTGAAPVVARLARDVGALTVGIVTKPFRFEGTRRASQADDGVDALASEVDTLIVVPNEKLLSVLAKNTTMVEAFQVADDVLRQGVQGISELITLPGLINLDFADVRTTMRDAGQALLGIGMGQGDNRAVTAAEKAVSSPLLETSVNGARSILLSITAGDDLTLLEVSDAAKVVQEAAHPDANIIFGANIDESLHDQVWITVIATRFDGRGRRADGSTSKRREAGTTSTSTRRPPERRAGTAREFESRPRDLELDVPEFVPGRN